MKQLFSSLLAWAIAAWNAWSSISSYPVRRAEFCICSGESEMNSISVSGFVTSRLSGRTDFPFNYSSPQSVINTVGNTIFFLFSSDSGFTRKAPIRSPPSCKSCSPEQRSWRFYEMLKLLPPATGHSVSIIESPFRKTRLATLE